MLLGALWELHGSFINVWNADKSSKEGKFVFWLLFIFTTNSLPDPAFPNSWHWLPIQLGFKYLK